MSNTTYLNLLLVSFFILGCKENQHDNRENQSHQGKPSTAYILPDIDYGTLQSPINILTAKTDSTSHQITFDFDGDVDKVENLGHTVQLDFAPGSDILLDTTTYQFKQLHFHTPSEHLIDGMTFPMEMHLVNTLKYPEQHQNESQYLVIGILFKMGEANRFIEEFINLIPLHEHEVTEVSHQKIHLPDLFKHPILPNETHFYHYEGSLTTPPYTESVSWFMLQEIQEASPQEIEKINLLEGNNARHIQAMFGRHIFNQ